MQTLNVRENQSNCIRPYDNPFEAWMSLFYCSDVNVFSIDYAPWNCLIYSYSLLRTAPEVSQYRKNTRATTF